MSNERFCPSSQSDMFAWDVVKNVRELAESQDITFDQAMKAYEIGVRAQQVDVLYFLGEYVDQLKDYMPDMGRVADGLNFVADSISDLEKTLGSASDDGNS